MYHIVYIVCLVTGSYEEVDDDGRRSVITTRMGKHVQLMFLRWGQGKQFDVARRGESKHLSIPTVIFNYARIHTV